MPVADGEPEPDVQRFTIEPTLVVEGDQDPDGWADSITVFVESLAGFVDEGRSGVSRVNHGALVAEGSTGGRCRG